MQTKTISKRKTTVMTTLTALFAALISAGAFIAIPLPVSPVPIAIQNLFAVLAGLVLGPVFGALSVGLYLLAGAIGAPVFAGATGGFVLIIIAIITFTIIGPIFIPRIPRQSQVKDITVIIPIDASDTVPSVIRNSGFHKVHDHSYNLISLVIHNSQLPSK
jgi:hypothetical protein